MSVFTIITSIALAALGGVAYVFSHYGRHHDATDQIVIGKGDCATCSGDDPRCEQECMMEAATKPIEYFDDEELDKFKERQSDSYTDDEAEMFREVLYTMKTEEVKDWCRSLTLRRVSLPDQVKDEVMLIIAN